MKKHTTCVLWPEVEADYLHRFTDSVIEVLESALEATLQTVQQLCQSTLNAGSALQLPLEMCVKLEHVWC